jgi:hypothetical protein
VKSHISFPSNIHIHHLFLTLCYRLIACGIYYYFWAEWIPKWRGYKLRQEVVDLGGGAEAHIVSRVPNDEVDAWDGTHDAAGRIRATGGLSFDKEKGARRSSEVDSKNVSGANTKLFV